MRMAEHFIPLVSSMAFLILFEHLAVVFWGSELRTLRRCSGCDLRIAGLVIGLPNSSGCPPSLALIFALTQLLDDAFGRALRTIAEDSRYRLPARRRYQPHLPVVLS